MALFRRNKTKDEPAAPVAKTDQPSARPDQPEAAKAPKPSSAKDSRTSAGRLAYKVLVHPLITEKSTIQGSLNQYAFVVDPRATKNEIIKAVQEVYRLKPVRVRVMNVLGKMVRSGRRGQSTRRKNWKKAVITLPQGKKIDVYEGV